MRIDRHLGNVLSDRSISTSSLGCGLRVHATDTTVLTDACAYVFAVLFARAFVYAVKLLSPPPFFPLRLQTKRMSNIMNDVVHHGV